MDELCTDVLGDRWGIKAMEHELWGHAPHAYVTSWFGRWHRETHHCPGVIHEHYWQRIGVVAAPVGGGSRTMIVQRCYCGTERQRMLNSELFQGREVPVE